MRFLKGEYYPHPPRGPGRGLYRMSDAARRARRQNLSWSRLRSDRETLVIKLLIWQSCLDNGPRLSQRALARQLGVWPSYVCKVQKQSGRGFEILTSGQRATLEDLDKVRHSTSSLSRQEPGLLRAASSPRSEKPPVLTEDEIIAKTWREVAEWKRKNLAYGGRRGWFRW